MGGSIISHSSAVSGRRGKEPAPPPTAVHRPPSEFPAGTPGNAYATCRLLEARGSKTIHPDLTDLVALHDDMTRASRDLPLA